MTDIVLYSGEKVTVFKNVSEVHLEAFLLSFKTKTGETVRTNLQYTIVDQVETVQ